MEKKPEQGTKLDTFKPDWSLLPWGALEEVVRVKTWAAHWKYARDNWKQVPNARRRYFAAAMRHIVKEWWVSGSKRDPEIGTHPLANGICCLLYLLHFELTGEWPADVPDITDTLGGPKGVDPAPYPVSESE